MNTLWVGLPILWTFLFENNDFSYTDSVFFNSRTDGIFYSFSEEKRLISSNNNERPLIRVFFYMDNKTDSYEMSLYTFWDMIGIVGGVYEVLKIICSIFMLIYTEKLMLVDLVNSYNKTKTQHRDSQDEENDSNHRLEQEQSNNRFLNSKIDMSHTDSFSYCDLLSWCKKKRSKSRVHNINNLKQTTSEKLNHDI